MSLEGGIGHQAQAFPLLPLVRLLSPGSVLGPSAQAGGVGGAACLGPAGVTGHPCLLRRRGVLGYGAFSAKIRRLSVTGWSTLDDPRIQDQEAHLFYKKVTPSTIAFVSNISKKRGKLVSHQRQVFV